MQLQPLAAPVTDTTTGADTYSMNQTVFILTVDHDASNLDPDFVKAAVGEALTDAGIEGLICEMQDDSVYAMLESGTMDVWGSDLPTQLAAKATTDNMSDIARIPLMQLANELKAGPNSARLYHEVTALADAANFAPDPTKMGD